MWAEQPKRQRCSKAKKSGSGDQGPSSWPLIPCENWQSSMGQIKERGAFIFNNEMLADVHFIFGEGTEVQRIPAHKLILSIGSSVFFAMFNGGLTATSNEIEIPDVEPPAFLAFLRFLYSDEVQIDEDNVLSVLYVAKKYIVPTLEFECVLFLEKILSSDNVFMLLIQARLFDQSELVEKCLEFVDSNFTAASAVDGFADIDLDTLCSVLSRDSSCVKEVELFQAVCKWAIAACRKRNLPETAENQRNVLGRALKLIRFPLMSIEEFSRHVVKSGLLLDKEVLSLFERMGTVDRFLGKVKSIRFDDNDVFHSINFFVNRPIMIVGLGLYGFNFSVKSDIYMDLFSTTASSDAISRAERSTCHFDEASLVYRVMYKTPIAITPLVEYTIIVEFEKFQERSDVSDPIQYSGFDGLAEIELPIPQDSNVKFSFLSSEDRSETLLTTARRGQIPQILFCM